MTPLLLAVSLAVAQEDPERARPEPLLLDAGGPETPLLEGFARLDLDGSTDPRVRWKVHPSRVFSRPGPDPLAADEMVGGVLHLDLAPGTWIVHALFAEGRSSSPGSRFGLKAGGAEVLQVEVPRGEQWMTSTWYASQPFPVFREGETEWDRQIAPRGGWRKAAVRVGEEGVELEAFGMPLTALVAVPRARAAEAEALLADADDRRRAWYHAYRAPAAEIWGVPSIEEPRIGRWGELPQDLPPAPLELDLELAAGERSAVALWLPGDAPARFEVRGLAEVDVDTHELHWLDASGYRGREQRPRPAFARPVDGELRGAQGAPVGLGLTFRVPDGALGGSREGALVIDRDGDRIEVPIRLRVRHLALAPAPLPMGFFLDVRGELSKAFGPTDARVLDAFRRDVALLRSHGFDLAAVRNLDSPRQWLRGRPVDTATVPEVARIWREAGGGPLVWVDPADAVLDTVLAPVDGEAFPDALEPVWLTLTDAARADDLAVLVYASQVGADLTRPERAAAFVDVARERGAGDLRLAGTGPHPLEWSLAEPLDILLIGREPAASSVHVERVRAAGASPWATDLHPGRLAPLMAWGMGVDACVQWHWNDGRGDPFDQLTPLSQYAILSPGGEIWPTVLLADLAEGRTDQRHLATLEALVSRLEAHPNPKRQAEAARGRALVDAARRTFDGLDPYGVHDGDAIGHRTLDELRGAVADEAERLQAELDRRWWRPRR